MLRIVGCVAFTKNMGIVKAFKNANVITVDEKNSRAQALAIDQDGLIAYVGSNEGLDKIVTEETEVVDAKGNTIVPGFIEGHGHPFMYGNVLRSIVVRDVSKEVIVERVAEAVKNSKPGQWIVAGMGFNNEVWEDPSYPTKEDLDAVSPDNPVIIPRMDGHLIWVNSKAFEICGVTKDTPNPDGGEYFRNEDGSLQGCAGNSAASFIKSHVPQETLDDLKEDVLEAQQAFLSMGLTSMTDMGCDFDDMQAVTDLIEEGKFKLRFYGCVIDFTGKNSNEKTRAFVKEGPKIGLYNDHFTIRCCKFLGDGAVGAQSAHMKEAYADRPGHTGFGMYTDEELYEAFKEAADNGMQIAIHAIGDATIEQVLRTYRRLQSEKDYGDHRWRLEHFQTVTGDTPEQAAELGVIPSMQPMHAPNSASMAIRRLGPDRIHGAYAPGLVIKSTSIVALGSDAPVATPSALSGIHAAITRTNDQLLPEGGFCMENALTAEEALKGYTIWGAYAQFCEDKRGSLEVGKQADLVVLDQDLLEVGNERPHDLLKINVLETYIDGERVFAKA